MMGAWKQESVICDPPIEEWSHFQFPYDGSIRRIDAINLPNLYDLSLDNQSHLTEFPWQDVPNLQLLSVYNSGFTELPIWKISSLTNCYCFDNASLLSVDAHGQTNLLSLDVSSAAALTAVNITGCTGLNSLYLSGLSLLTELDISTCINLNSINITSCDGITAIETSGCPALAQVTLNYCGGFTALDVSNFPQMEYLYLVHCNSLSDVNLSGCGQLDYVYLRYMPFDQAMVDQIFEDLVDNGASDGYLRIDGTGVAVPSNPDGLASKATLISRGWKVYTN
ncbi:MAG TPA: hypothetical protein PKK48_00840 [Phycisphaerae bacterium]|nr:hypothetical protein [Phycisphaerae bacterium]